MKITGNVGKISKILGMIILRPVLFILWYICL